MHPVILVMFSSSLSADSVGFLKPKYFISSGYAAAVCIQTWAAWVFLRPQLWSLSTVHAILLMVYGTRLFCFLVHREHTPPYYREKCEIDENSQRLLRDVAPGSRVWHSVGLWLSCSCLYTLMCYPLAGILQSADVFLPSLVVGLPIVFAGFLIEVIADMQKSAYKAAASSTDTHLPPFITSGAYRYLRHPNYFGEMVFWLGAWVAGISTYATWQDWAISSVGLLAILGVMWQATNYLAAKHERKYGYMEIWIKYKQRTPLVLPFIW